MGAFPVKVICVVGARPNFIKAAPVVEALRRWTGVQVRLIHTGQHHDQEMSKVFFEELGLPVPDVDLQVGSASHGEQTGLIMIRLERVLTQEHPDLVIVFGDVNSTVAASLCAAKLGIKVAHVEAGLRSFDRSMPEELNRIVTDHLSDYLFVTERSGLENLSREGISEDRIFFVGNVMVDTLLKHRERTRASGVQEKLGLTSGGYGILTLHRPSNVDDPKTLDKILKTIKKAAMELPIIFPCHPRTRQQLGQHPHDLTHKASGLIILEPLGYMEFLSLMSEALLVLTDSGGIQEETTVLGVPCLTLRDNTERPVTIEQGTNVLVGNSPSRIMTAISEVLKGVVSKGRVPDLWDGKAAERIVDILQARLGHAEHSSAGAVK
jgi:UDP-N-acetylglucosamine 2-epimerase (non-hydrolysing)